jgi:hypothetical protein
MVGNICFPLLMHDKRGRRARNNGSIEVLSPDRKKVMSFRLYYASESVLLSLSRFRKSIMAQGLNTVL